MKANRYLLIVISILLSIYACKDRSYPNALTLADSLTSSKPDSVIALLRTLKSDILTASEETQMYYHLLCIKANDKAYVLHTSDSLIRKVLHYYIDKDDKRHLPEAYYYAGRVYRDLGDAPQALAYFEKALEELAQEKDEDLKSRIYSQMGTLFAYQEMYTEALEMYKKGQQNYKVLKDKVGIVFSSRDIANMYIELGKTDSALVYFKESILLSQQLQRTDLFNMVQSQLTTLYIDLQEFDSARVSLQYALRDIEQPNKSGIYAIAAYFYDAIGREDSSIWYYNKLLDCGSIYAQRTAYRRLLEFSIKQNSTKRAPGFLYGYLRCTDSIQELAQTETIRRMHSLYNYQLREKENLQLKNENHNKILWIWIITGWLVITLLFFIAYRQYSKRKGLELKQQLNKLQTIKRENQEKIEFLEKYKLQKEELEKSLENINISESNIQKKRLGQKLEMLNYILQQKTIENEQEQEAQEYLFNSDLYKQLLERINSVRGEAYITSKEWSLLKENLNPAFPTFFERLYSLHTPNENELHVCILLKLQFRPADIARLLELKPESISSIRKRLYQKVTGNSGSPEMWDKIIYSL